MTLSAGTRLGPYEILAPLGAGGMGEVYKARDDRLKREVAIKVLPAELAADPERRGRFEREARAASGLSHPNILTVYDIGSTDSIVYIAMELVEGGTLKDLVASGPVPVRKLLELATQIAEGLAAAHAAGIVHRDLKPANVMLSKHGFAKVLDFGLAKLVAPDDGEVSALQTAVGDATRPGMVMGTVGYMSPEQAAGRPLDFRSDQFSFGSILYEMATGKRAFERGTTAETLTAIIREEPAPVSQLNPKVPAPIRWLLERCLAKDPEDRFGTTKDLARDLASIRDHLSEAPMSGEATGQQPAAAARRTRRLWPFLAGAAVLAAVVGLAAYAAGRKEGRVPPPVFRELTFQRGEIHSARFAPDGQTILYGASWEGRPVEIFVSRLDSPEARPFGLKSADVFAISPSGEMAVSLNRRFAGPFQRTGTLARIGVTGGGTPREVQEDVQWADWAPDGKSLAIVRVVGTRSRVEYPIGKALYETEGWVSNPRVSPDGDRVAFMDHPIIGDDGGVVEVVDRAGKRTRLAGEFSTEGGLAWSPSGAEVWFTAAETGGNRALFAVTLSGARRVLARVTGNLTLQDVSREGRALISHDALRSGILVWTPGDSKERDLSWLDWSSVRDIAPDGSVFIFSETGEGGGAAYSAYSRRMDGSPPVRLGEGNPFSISSDGRWALSISGATGKRGLLLLPTGAGEARAIAANLQVQAVTWFPDGKRILLTASEEGRGARLYQLDGPDAKPRALSPPGYRAFSRCVSPDSKYATVLGPDSKRYLYPLTGGEPAPIPGLLEDESPIGWTADGRSIYVYKRGLYPARIFRLEIATGKRELWKELTPPDPAGISNVAPPAIAADEKTYAYSYNRILSDLFLAEGLK
ncbi:MAG: protein kinase [Acidobacteriota bacterium]|nr:protein kinase [Acidobacteriota bacterium]